MSGKSGLKTVLWLLLGVALGFGLGLLTRREAPTQPLSMSIKEVIVSTSPPTAVALPVGPVGVTNEPPPVSGLQRLKELCSDPRNLDLAECLMLVKTLAAEECRGAIDLFRQLPRDERRLLERAAARRWASVDAEAMLKSVFPIRDWERQSVLVEEAAGALARHDADAALAMLENAPTVQRLVISKFILSALAERDPARAAAHLASRRELASDHDLHEAIASRLASADPQQAAAWVAGLPNGRARSEAAKAVGRAWAQKDPAAVAAELLRARDRWDREAVTAVAQNWSQRDPRATMAWIAALPIKEDQNAAWSAFKLDVSQTGTEVALELLGTIPSEKGRADIAAQAAHKMASENPRTALTWAERLPEGTVRNSALRPVLDEMAASSPVEAVSYVATLPAGNTRTDLLRRAVGSWARQDPEAALTWSQQLPKGSERDQLLGQAALELRKIDPAAAARWSEMTENPGLRQNIIKEVIETWASIDGAAAAQWLSQLPDTDAQVKAHHELARQWAFTDMEGSANWIRSLPPGSNRDAAIGAFVESVDGYDAALATTWAMAIGEPKRRQENVRSAFRRWMQSDPESARTWLSDAALDEDFRAVLAQAAEKRSRP